MKHTINQRGCAICGAVLGSSSNKRKHRIRQLCFQCKSNGPSEEYRCTATTNRGDRCHHWALDDQTVCRTHEVKK